jgi:signal transduction histidine kinase
LATLVAYGAPPGEVFGAVAREVGQILEVRHAVVARYEPDATVTTVGVWNSGLVATTPLGSRFPLEKGTVTELVARTKAPGRIDAYHATVGAGELLTALRDMGLDSAVGCPVTVGGCLWGAVIAGSTSEPLPEDTEKRMLDFTDLVATAIANADSHAKLEASRARVLAASDKLRLFAREQRALRRIATLVARGVEPDDLFTAVATETGRLLGADHTLILRYEPDNTVTVVGYWNDPRSPHVFPPLDGHWPVEDRTVTAAVLTSGRPARMTNYEHATSAIGVWAGSNGICCVVGCPVTVEGRVWGALVISSVATEAPPGTEDRMRQLVELISTAIANAQSHSDLLASRARVVTAADESRQRLERKLHDGTQQRLVSATLRIRIAQASVTPEQEELDQQLSVAVEDLSQALAEVQEISRGIAPSTLTAKGLPSALRSLARRSTVPVELDVRIDQRLPEPVETAIYYTVSEALTNVTKHARATTVDVHIRVQDTVRLSIEDDGIGGADLRRGTGLVGLKDRVEALDGRLDIVSPTGHGTALLADIPIGAGAGLGVRAARRGIRTDADS